MTHPLASARPCSNCTAPIIFRRRAEDTRRWVVLDASAVHPDYSRGQLRTLLGRLAYLPDQLDERDSPTNALAIDHRMRRRAPEPRSTHTVHACPRKEG